MPHYRITIKLENKPVQEYVIEDSRSQIDFVYLDYRNRVHKKNGAGSVIYFDLVMLAEEAIKHLEDREEVFNQKNNFGISDFQSFKKKKQKGTFDKPQTTLEERIKNNRNS